MKQTSQEGKEDMAKPVSALCKLRVNLSGLSNSDDDVFAAMVRRIDRALIEREEELQWLIDASKGGNIRGVTEDRRFVWMDELQEVRATKFEVAARALGWVTEQERHGVDDYHGAVHPNGHWCPDWQDAVVRHDMLEAKRKAADARATAALVSPRDPVGSQSIED